MKIGKKLIIDIRHDTGFPGKPKKYFLLESLPKVVGFPGLTATLSKRIFKPFFFNDDFTMSYFPLDIPPLVIKKSKTFCDLKVLIKFL